MNMTWTTILIITSVLLSLTDAQSNNQSQTFVLQGVPPISQSDEANYKIFTTIVNLTPLTQATNFNSSVFLNAANVFYAAALNGFQSITILNNSIVNNEITVSYTVNYTSSDIASDPRAGNDNSVISAIGNLSAVRNGLESNSDFKALYNVSTSANAAFSFTGNKLCQFTQCPSSSVTCFESDLGLSQICRSICATTFICQNAGICVHRNVNRSPNCHCPGQSTVWYLGERCDYEVVVWMVVVFLLLFFLLIALMILIGYFCCRIKPKPKKEKSKYLYTSKMTEKPKTAAITNGTTSPVAAVNPPATATTANEVNTLPRSVATHSDNALMAVQIPQSRSSNSDYSLGLYEDARFAEPPPVDEDVEIVSVGQLQNIPEDEPDASAESSSSSDYEQEEERREEQEPKSEDSSSSSEEEEENRDYNRLDVNQPVKTQNNAEVTNAKT